MTRTSLRRLFARRSIRALLALIALFLAVDAAALALFAFKIGLFPHHEAIRGSGAFWPLRSFLEDHGLVAPDEELLWFYSDGLFASRLRGNVVTDRRLSVYRRDSFAGELEIESAPYSEITWIHATFHDPSPFSRTTGVKVIHGEGDELFLAVGRGVDRDPESLRDVRRLWEEQRAKEVPPWRGR